MFPLSILPLPGELVPLHIFEPRYRQLLQDLESSDMAFGIYFSHEINEQKLGSLMKLESIIKRHSGGETDIIVKCIDVFTMNTLYRTFQNKMYPGGDVALWNMNTTHLPGEELYVLFREYMEQRKIKHHQASNIFEIANELSLDFHDRYKFLLAKDDGREKMLVNRVLFLTHLLKQEHRSKDVYHLN